MINRRYIPKNKKYETPTRSEYLQNEHEPSWNDWIQDEMENIRQENINAVKYAVMWLGLASIIFTLLGQLLISNNGLQFTELLIYVEILIFICMLLFITAGMQFFHGSSSDHSLREYIELNENGDSLVMLGSLILITSFSLFITYILLVNSELSKYLALYIPIILILVALFIINNLSIKTPVKEQNNGKSREEGIIMHYFHEAARTPFYRYAQKYSGGLETILCRTKNRLESMVLLLILLLIMIIPCLIIK